MSRKSKNQEEEKREEIPREDIENQKSLLISSTKDFLKAIHQLLASDPTLSSQSQSHLLTINLRVLTKKEWGENYSQIENDIGTIVMLINFICENLTSSHPQYDYLRNSYHKCVALLKEWEELKEKHEGSKGKVNGKDNVTLPAEELFPIYSSLERLTLADPVPQLLATRLSHLRINPFAMKMSYDINFGKGDFGEIRCGQYNNQTVAIKVLKLNTEQAAVTPPSTTTSTVTTTTTTTTKGNGKGTKSKNKGKDKGKSKGKGKEEEAVSRMIFERRRSIEKEVLLMSLCNHSCIQKIFGYGYDILEPETSFMLLELGSLGSLWSLLNDKDKFPLIPECLSIAWLCDILSALAYLHERRIVYGEMNAEKVSLADGLYCKLTDFDLSKQTTAADMYSFGITCYQVLERSSPSINPIAQNILDTLSSKWPHFTHLIDSCLRENPEERVPSQEAHVMVRDILQNSGGDPRGWKFHNHPSYEATQIIQRIKLWDALYKSCFSYKYPEELFESELCCSLYLISRHGNASVSAVLSSLATKKKLTDESMGYVLLSKINASQVHIVPDRNFTQIISKIQTKILKDTVPLMLEFPNGILNKYTLLNHHELFFLAMAYSRGLDVEKDMTLAIEFLRLSSEQGNGAAFYHLGLCYFAGDGVQQNVKEASRLFHLSLNQSNGGIKFFIERFFLGYSSPPTTLTDVERSVALFNLGEFYRIGQGVYKNLSEAVAYYLDSSNLGYSNAQFNLGVCYHRSPSAESYPKAVKYYKLAADQGNVMAQFMLGTCYEQGQGVTQNLTKAFTYFKRAADQGSGSAQYYLGVCYVNGFGVAPDPAMAVKYLKLSSDQGFSKAQYNLGVCFHQGLGVPQNSLKAVKYYKLAADQGNSSAQCNLGICYVQGDGVAKNMSDAAKYFRLSANQGDSDAQFYLGSCYIRGEGVPRNYTTGAKYFKLAADQGQPEAQYNLGACYYQGDGVARDHEEAKKYFKMSADQGHAAAQYNLALCYDQCEESMIDYVEAAKYYQLSADQGYEAAQCNLGVCYQKGLGVPQDYSLAVKYYKLAAAQGIPDAQFNLGSNYEYGKGVPPNEGIAFHYYKLAADQGHANGQFHLAIFYWEGHGVPRNVSFAVHLFRLAANQGNSFANFYLGICYAVGVCVEKNRSEAINCFHLSAR